MDPSLVISLCDCAKNVPPARDGFPELATSGLTGHGLAGRGVEKTLVLKFCDADEKMRKRLAPGHRSFLQRQFQIQTGAFAWASFDDERAAEQLSPFAHSG